MKLILAIAAGGAMGAVGRHYVGVFALKWLGSGSLSARSRSTLQARFSWVF